MFTTLFTDGVWNTSCKTDLKDYCDFIRNNDNGRVASNTGGYHSNYLNLSDSILQPLISHLQKETLYYSRLFNLKYDSYKVDTMWININGYRDYNVNHIHPGCLFSGVYYVHTPKDCGNIEFVRTTKHLMMYDWKIPITEWNHHNCFGWYLPAEKHKCYIFPSFYEHRVLPNLNKKEKRYSISFNISSNS